MDVGGVTPAQDKDNIYAMTGNLIANNIIQSLKKRVMTLGVTNTIVILPNVNTAPRQTNTSTAQLMLSEKLPVVITTRAPPLKSFWMSCNDSLICLLNIT